MVTYPRHAREKLAISGWLQVPQVGADVYAEITGIIYKLSYKVMNSRGRSRYVRNVHVPAECAIPLASATCGRPPEY